MLTLIQLFLAVSQVKEKASVNAPPIRQPILIFLFPYMTYHVPVTAWYLHLKADGLR